MEMLHDCRMSGCTAPLLLAPADHPLSLALSLAHTIHLSNGLRIYSVSSKVSGVLQPLLEQ